MTVYQYASRDPRRPFAVGASVGSLGFQWKFGSKEKADEIAKALKTGKLNPREVF